MRLIYKCFACGGLTDKIKVAHDYNGGDPLMCPLCGAIEPGFAEIEEEEENEIYSDI